MRRHRPTLLLALGVLALLLGWGARPERADAHPLGNFTINRYARVEPGADAITIVYALDLAEIPTFQEAPTLDRDRDGRVSEAERLAYLDRKLPELASNLRLVVAGQPLGVQPTGGLVALSEGQGGLSVLRLDATFIAPLPSALRAGAHDAEFRDGNYDNRLGWKEIVVRGTAGAAIAASSVPATDVSDALRAYPEDSLQSPLEVREARFRFEPGVAGAEAPLTTAARIAERTSRVTEGGFLDRFARQAAVQDLTLPVLLISLAAAVFWGALHALGPGHGKTVVAAYLVGSRGTAKQALLLGLTVTATHTAGVYLLGFITLSASHFIVPERLYPVLSLASGLLIVLIGVQLLWSRLRGSGLLPFTAARAHAHADHHHHDDEAEHEHEHGHDHAHPGRHHHHGHDDGDPHHHGHSHAIPGLDGAPVTWRSLVALGVYGGLIPCPTAIVVLLTSISLNRVGFGLLLVVAFSAGLAAVLTGIGLLLVYAGRAFSRVRVGGAVTRLVPVASAAAVIVVGVLITLRAAGQGGLPLV